MSATPRFSLHSLEGEREKLLRHPIYRSITTLSELRIFMEHHVFAVWDFMSLLKALQRELTCVAIPWVPQGDRLSRRLINEIVLEEESDAAGASYVSHFELYRAAMAQCGADLSRIDAFLKAIRNGESTEAALEHAGAPKAAASFVENTMQIVASGSICSIAAAFTLGREDVIPKMFAPLVANLEVQFPGQLTIFRDYLERHIHLDEERHTPMALQMLAELCGKDLFKWRQAEGAARTALIARLALWDGVVEQIVTTKRRAAKTTGGLGTASLTRDSRQSTPCSEPTAASSEP